MAHVDAIIIGAGPSGIAMAHKLKQLGFEKFKVRLTELAVGSRGSCTTRSTKSWTDQAEHGGQTCTLAGIETLRSNMRS